MQWLELSIEAPREYAEPLSTIFARYGTGGSVIEETGGYNPDEGDGPPPNAPVTVKTYIPVDGATASSKNNIEVAVRLVALLHPLPRLNEKIIEEQDWENSWKAHFRPLRVAPHLVIKPSWHFYEPKKDDIVVELDPGLAFGTGYHPTTRACLRALQSTIHPNDRIIDVGTGSGILAISALKLGARAVLALDMDPQAVKATRSNGRRNSVGKALQVRRGTLPNSHCNPPYELVLANISATTVVNMAKVFYEVLCDGGHLIASGIVQDRSAEVLYALAQSGFTLVRRIDDGLWVTLLLCKPS